MNTKTIAFELDGGEVEIDVEWSYSYDPGKIYGDPENCHPASEEYEVLPPKDDELRRLLMAHAEKQVEVWMLQIKDQCMDMEWHRKPREWAEEDSDEYT